MKTLYLELSCHFFWKKVVCLLLIASFFQGCADDEGFVRITDVTYFTESSFPVQKQLSHTIHNADFIGDLARLSRVDTLLFAVDSKTDTLVHVFSTRTPQLTFNIIGKGGGPNEMISVGYVREGQKPYTYCVYDITRKFWQTGVIDSTDRQFKKTSSFSFKHEAYDRYSVEEPIWLSDQAFVCVSLIHYKERYLVFNDSNELLYTGINPYMRFNEDFSAGILSELSSTVGSVKPDKSQLVLAGRYLNYIEIYQLQENRLLHHLMGPTLSDPRFDVNNSVRMNTLIKSRETVKSYLCVDSSDQRIYLLYSGKEIQDPSGYTHSKIVYSFHWDGTPHTAYRLYTEVTSFAVDEEHGKLYAVSYPDNSIVSFDL